MEIQVIAGAKGVQQMSSSCCISDIWSVVVDD